MYTTHNFNIGQEYWQQDQADLDLWHGPKGLIINTAALQERASYYRLGLKPSVSLTEASVSPSHSKALSSI